MHWDSTLKTFQSCIMEHGRLQRALAVTRRYKGDEEAASLLTDTVSDNPGGLSTP